MKYWISQFFLIFLYFYPLNEKGTSSKFFGLMICGFWVMATWKLAPDTIKTWKTTIYQLCNSICNAIHLLNGALRKILVLIVIAWVDIFQEIPILFRKLKTIAQNHNKINVLSCLTLIFKFCLGYPLSKLYFSQKFQGFSQK